MEASQGEKSLLAPGKCREMPNLHRRHYEPFRWWKALTRTRNLLLEPTVFWSRARSYTRILPTE
jgi:hypothetical protein